MNAEKFLKQYAECRRRIQKLKSDIQQLEDLMEHITPEMSSDRVQTSPTPDRIGELVARKSDLEEQMLDEISTTLDVMNDIEAVINRVEPVGYQVLLQKRYIEWDERTGRVKTWCEIACELHYSYQWINVLRKRSLQKVEAIIQ